MIEHVQALQSVNTHNNLSCFTQAAQVLDRSKGPVKETKNPGETEGIMSTIQKGKKKGGGNEIPFQVKNFVKTDGLLQSLQMNE